MTWTVYGGVSAAAGVVCLLVALIMWTIGNQMWKPVVLGLTITGVAGIMVSPVGSWIRWAVDLFNNSAVGRWIGQYTGIGLLALIALGLALIVLLNVLAHFNVKGGVGDGSGIDGRTVSLGAALPIFAGAIPGIVGVGIVTVLGFITQIFALPIAYGLGLL